MCSVLQEHIISEFTIFSALVTLIIELPGLNSSQNYDGKLDIYFVTLSNSIWSRTISINFIKGPQFIYLTYQSTKEFLYIIQIYK